MGEITAGWGECWHAQKKAHNTSEKADFYLGNGCDKASMDNLGQSWIEWEAQAPGLSATWKETGKELTIMGKTVRFHNKHLPPKLSKLLFRRQIIFSLFLQARNGEQNIACHFHIDLWPMFDGPFSPSFYFKSLPCQFHKEPTWLGSFVSRGALWVVRLAAGWYSAMPGCWSSIRTILPIYGLLQEPDKSTFVCLLQN